MCSVTIIFVLETFKMIYWCRMTVDGLADFPCDFPSLPYTCRLGIQEELSPIFVASFEERSFLFFAEKRDVFQAQAECARVGGNLATVEDSGVYEFVAGIRLEAQIDEFYFGLVSFGDPSSGSQRFFYIDGSEFDTSFIHTPAGTAPWGENQPDGFEALEECVLYGFWFVFWR